MWLFVSWRSTRSNIRMASILPWHNLKLSIEIELWTVAGSQWILEFGAILVWILVFGRLTRAIHTLSSHWSSHLESEYYNAVFGFWIVNELLSVTSHDCNQYRKHSVLYAGRFGTLNIPWISSFLNYLWKPGHKADTLLIVALPSFRSLWVFPMCMLAFFTHCRSWLWDSRNSVLPST